MNKMFGAAAVAIAVAAGSMASGISAWAQTGGKPILSDMVVDNDLSVRQVRDGLMAFAQTKGRWPGSLEELVQEATARGHTIDLGAFATTRYGVQNSDGKSVALFEFSTANPTVTGAFAVAIYDVR